jgi:ribosomal protein S18 acetylase RimI-like enzyme
MQIEYKINADLSADQFVALLRKTTLGERRPLEDRACLEGMINNCNLTITAWADERLIGIARSLTDFHFACYLSDLAVDEAYQGRGIGKRLQAITQAQLGPRCSLILLAAPAADSYYAHLGYSRHPRCWVLERDRRIRG